MKVRYNIDSLSEKLDSELTKNEEQYFSGFSVMPSKLNLTFDKTYTVLGLEYTSNGFVNFMLADDTGVTYPKFYPLEFFDIIDDRASKFWINKNSDRFPFEEIGCPNLVTFREAVNDDSFFDNLLESNNEAVEIYENYKDLMEKEFPDIELNDARKIDDTWVICSHCDTVWEAGRSQGIVICPKEGHRNNNPNWEK